MRSSRLAVLALSAVAQACSGDDSAGGDDGSCSLAVALSGAIQATVSARDSIACASQRSLDSGIDTSFIVAGDTLTQFGLQIANVLEGEMAGAYPTRLDITRGDGERFVTSVEDCSVTLEQHALESKQVSELGEERHYALAGSGTCAAPAVARGSSAAGEVTIGAFRFRSFVVWRD